MKSRSPTLEGFRTLFRQPSFGLGEISWRWAFGAAAVALLAFAFLEYLNTLPVTAVDLLLLRTRQPTLVGQAIAHILRGSAQRFVHATILLAVFLSFAWIILATLGRAATTRGLLGYLSDNEQSPSFSLTSLVGLNFLRVAATLAAVIGFPGAMLLGGMASPGKDPSPGSAMLVFLGAFSAVSLAWAFSNWLLSLASVFVVSHGLDTFGAITAAVGLCRDQPGPILATSSWFGLAHGVAFFIASFVVAFPLAFAPVLPAGVVLVGVLLVTLIYFFVADFLYVGRLAAYVYIIAGPEPQEITQPAPPTLGPPQQSVDRDELILSDVPLIPEPGA